MTTPRLSSRRFCFLHADEQEALPPGHLRGKLREVAGNLWFRLPDPRPPDASFVLVVQCVEPADAEAGWRADELDRIVAEVLPALQRGAVLISGTEGCDAGAVATTADAATAAAACLLAKGTWSHIDAAFGAVRTPGRKIPKALRRSLRDWWASRRAALPPSPETWSSLNAIQPFRETWHLRALAPFGATSLMRQVGWLTEGLDEATPHIIASEAGSDPGRAVTEAAREFAVAARAILDELESEDPVAGASLRERWEAWWQKICEELGVRG